MRRTARDVQIDRKKIIDPVAYLFVIRKDAAGYGAGAGSNDQLGFGDCFVGLEQRFLHIHGHRSGDEHAVGMSWRGYEFDPEAAGIKDHIAESVHFGLAAIAPSGTHFAQSQGSSQKPSQSVAYRIDASALTEPL